MPLEVLLSFDHFCRVIGLQQPLLDGGTYSDVLYIVLSTRSLIYFRSSDVRIGNLGIKKPLCCRVRKPLEEIVVRLSYPLMAVFVKLNYVIFY